MATVAIPRRVAESEAKTAMCMNNAFLSGFILEPSAEENHQTTEKRWEQSRDVSSEDPKYRS